MAHPMLTPHLQAHACRHLMVYSVKVGKVLSCDGYDIGAVLRALALPSQAPVRAAFCTRTAGKLDGTLNVQQNLCVARARGRLGGGCRVSQV